MAYNVRFLKGAQADFTNLVTKDLNTFYYVDEKDLYLGEIKLSNGADLAAAIERVATNETDIENIQKELAALTGNEGGTSINQMITEAINALRTELNTTIQANTNAIDEIEKDYLKAADKTELQGNIDTLSEKVNTNEGILNEVKADVDYFFKDALGDSDAQQVKDTLKEIQEYIDSDATAAGEMTSNIQANTNAIETLNGDVNTTGSVDKKIADAIAKENLAQYATDNELTAASEATLESAKEYADSLASNYATAEQGTKADSALQKDDITTGTTNGTISVKGTDVSVYGLGTAAYTASTDYDAAGSAASALTSAKAYTDTALTWGDI